MRLELVALVAFGAACSHAAAAPEPVPPTPRAIDCEPYVYKVLVPAHHEEHDGPPLVTANDAAQGQANADYAAAVVAAQAGDPHAAALKFVDCARRFIAVPAGDPFEGSAIYNAQVCYFDAIYAFANAGGLTPDGRDALRTAALADPRNTDFIMHTVVGPVDQPRECVTPQPQRR